MPKPKFLKTLPMPRASIGVGIMKNPNGLLHVGVVYRRRKSNEQFLDLKWHSRIRSIEIQKDRLPLLWVQLEIDDDVIDSLFALCKKVGETKPDVLYGLRYIGGEINKNGILKLVPGELGLTCATFVLAVFEGAGITLLDCTTWEARPEKDKPFHDVIVDALKRTSTVTRQHLNAVENEKGCARFRPEEVAGACSILNRPVSFTSANKVGVQLADYYNV
jgi:hypothetical protein